MTNPVGIDEVLARLRAVLRRTAPSGEPMIRIGGLVVDLQKRAVSVGGEPVDFAPRQYDTTNLLHVNVSQLRRKLAGAGGVTPLS